MHVHMHDAWHQKKSRQGVKVDVSCRLSAFQDILYMRPRKWSYVPYMHQCMHYSTYYHHPNTGDALYQLSLEVNCGVNPLFDARIYAITVAETRLASRQLVERSYRISRYTA